MHLKTFDGLTVHGDNDCERAPVMSDTKGAAVMAYLASVPGREARRDHLVQLLWPQAGLSSGRRRLRQTLYRVRTQLDDQLLYREGDSIRLHSDKLSVDHWQFRAAIRSDQYERAVRLYKGPFLKSYRRKARGEFVRWIDTQQQALRRDFRDVLATLVQQQSQSGNEKRAFEYVWRAVQVKKLDPLSPETRKLLVRVLEQAGTPEVAHRAYQEYLHLTLTKLHGEVDLTQTLDALRAVIARGSE